jgi:hypothetical protein
VSNELRIECQRLDEILYERFLWRGRREQMGGGKNLHREILRRSNGAGNLADGCWALNFGIEEMRRFRVKASALLLANDRRPLRWIDNSIGRRGGDHPPDQEECRIVCVRKCGELGSLGCGSQLV